VPVVSASAGAELFQVLLDTGAARTSFDTEAARRLGLDIDLRLIPLILTNGEDHEWIWHTAEVDRLELGSARMDGLRAPAFELSVLLKEVGAIAAIVGQDFLAALVLVVDGERREVELVPAQQRAEALERRWPGREWRALELDYAGGCPYVELELEGGQTARLMVDTGAVVSAVPSEVLERIGSDAVGRAKVSGRIGGEQTSDLHRIESLRIAGWDVALAATARDGSTGLLSMDVLDLFPVAIDGPARTLWIATPAPGDEPRVETTPYKLTRIGSRAAEFADG
jgi:predicted aspartyl protease